MRFGVFIPQGWRLDLVGIDVADQWDTMLGVAKQAERLGYESAWVFDHFHTIPTATQEVTYEAWSLMAALAAATDTIRLGQMCTCNSYRPPSYLAKVAASVDAISGGRVEMGIGAGWYEEEYLAYGYEFRSGGTRLRRLRESVEIMNAMWTEEEASYQGEHYTLDGAICQPKPVQDPTIPMWIAGSGEKVTLRIVAEHADYSNTVGPPDNFARLGRILNGYCEEIGRDPKEITRSTFFHLFIGETEKNAQEQWDATAERWRLPSLTDPDQTMSRWHGGGHALVGTPAQVVDQLGEWVEAGAEFGTINVPQAAYNPDQLELFAAEVAPAFR